MRQHVLSIAIALTMAVGVAAQDKPKIVKLSPEGPGAWQQGNGTTKSQSYYRSATEPRQTVGVWASNEPGGKVRKATYTEFIYILEGSVQFEDKNGKETVFNAGDAVVIPRGTEFAWKKSNNMKEYYVIFDREAPGVAPVSGEPMFYKISADGPAGKGLAADKNGRTKEHEYFSGPDGSSVGVWETAPHTSPAFHETKYAELMIFLKGNVTLSTPDGQKETFKAGEVALVPKGVQYKWSSDTVRKFWVIFDATPKASSTAGQ